MSTELRVYFDGDVIVTVDDYERSTEPAETWDLKRLAEAVQDEIGHAGVLVNAVTDWVET